jgi:hypothetical protein
MQRVTFAEMVSQQGGRPVGFAFAEELAFLGGERGSGGNTTVFPPSLAVVRALFQARAKHAAR